jgi:hypothetical protein
VGFGLRGRCGGFGGGSSFFVCFPCLDVFELPAALSRGLVCPATPDPRVFAI